MSHSITVSKHYKAKRHVGFKKFIAGKNFHLITGTGSEHETAAKAIALELIAKVTAGITLTREAVGEVKSAHRVAATGQASQAAANRVAVDSSSTTLAYVDPVGVPGPVLPIARDEPTLYAVIELYKTDEHKRFLAGDIAAATCISNRDNIEMSKGIVSTDGLAVSAGIGDIPMNKLDFAELTRWIRFWKGKPTLNGGKPIGAYRASSVLVTMRHFLRAFAKPNKYWHGFEDWRELFKGVAPKSLMSPSERVERRRKTSLNYSLTEAQVLWHLCPSYLKAYWGIALWCGHTQNEIATIRMDEFRWWKGSLYLGRSRTKTGVEGRWWIPPEVADHVRNRLMAADERINPNGLAFLGRNGLPLVQWHPDKRPTDALGQAWESVMTAAERYGVRRISFKYARKTMAQQVRNALGGDYATAFCAQELTDVQSNHYSRPDPKNLMRTIRESIYPGWQRMFQPPDLRCVSEQLRLEEKRREDEENNLMFG